MPGLTRRRIQSPAACLSDSDGLDPGLLDDETLLSDDAVSLGDLGEDLAATERRTEEARTGDDPLHIPQELADNPNGILTPYAFGF